MEEERVWLASRNLEDDARMWFRQVQQDEGTPTWCRFTELLHLRFGAPPAATIDLVDGMCRLQEDLDRLTLMINRYCAQAEKSERERLAAGRLQAAARGFLARRRVRSLREEAAVQLQAVARRSMARHTTRKLRECLAAVRLQAAACGLLARRRAQSLREVQRLAAISPAIKWPSSEHRVAVCLQAAGRGFLVRRWVQKLCMLLRMSLQHIATCPVIHLGSPIHPAAPTQEAIWVCNLPVWTSTTKQSPRHLPPASPTTSTATASSRPLGSVTCLGVAGQD